MNNVCTLRQPGNTITSGVPQDAHGRRAIMPLNLCQNDVAITSSDELHPSCPKARMAAASVA